MDPLVSTAGNTRSSTMLDNPKARGTPLRILVADDDEVARCLTEEMLRRQDFEVILASSGREAIEAFERERPDVVIMDVMMPGMDGYETASEIKRNAGSHFVPLIFLTGLADDETLTHCIAAGGDDYLTKPCKAVEMGAKIAALTRVKRIYDEARARNEELLQHRRHLEREHEIAKQLFSKITGLENLSLDTVQYLISPVSIFNGDLLLAAPTPLGGLNVLVGDFTGHGLAAAIGALPASEIFSGMTAKGYSVSEIAKEINRKLREVLPTGLFFAACLIELDPEYRTLSVWSGGLPDALIVPANGGDLKRITSKHLPLGIIDPEAFHAGLEQFSVEHADRVYLYSDGVVEASGAGGSMFGEERLVRFLLDHRGEAQVLQRLSETLAEFRGSDAQQDDITMVEVTCAPVDASQATESVLSKSMPPADWRLSLELEASALRQCDPLPLVLQVVTELQGLQLHRNNIYTVLAELYSNALEHGVLGLDSELKSDADGFAKYYQLRKERLENLGDGRLQVDLKHTGDVDGGRLSISIQDNGQGFSYGGAASKGVGRENLCGRGIPLVRELCESLTYGDRGRLANAVYVWDAERGGCKAD